MARTVGRAEQIVDEGQTLCTCLEPLDSDDANVTGFDVVRRATEGR